MTDLSVSIVGGLNLGATYALLACGLVLIFRATQVLNFAHGGFMLVAAYATAVVAGGSPLSFLAALLVGLSAAALLGALFYRVVLARMTGLPHFMPVIATIGLASVIDAGVGLWVGARQYVIEVPGLPDGSVTILGANASKAELALSGISLAVVAIVIAVAARTDFGRRLRAAGQDPALASQSGINVNRIYLVSWVIAGALAAVAGITYSASNVVGPGIVPLALLAFPAMLLGGLDSLWGGLVGGLAIGVLQGFVATYLGGDAINAVTYGVLLAILLIAPSGLFGTVERQKL